MFFLQNFVYIFVQNLNQLSTTMKQLLSLLIVLCSTIVLNAQVKEWSLKTDTGESVNLSEVDYLLAADEYRLFSVVLKGGATIDNVSQATFSDISSVYQVKADEGLSLFPNPVRATLNISGCQQGSTVAVLSLDGQLLISTVASAHSLTIDVSNLPQGTYLLKTDHSVVKFIKK